MSLYNRLRTGLEEGIEHVAGKRTLRSNDVQIPDAPPSYDSDSVRRIRSRLRMSQTAFSRLVNVSEKTVESWEQGVRRPSQAAARLLQIIETPSWIESVVAIERVATAAMIGEERAEYGAPDAEPRQPGTIDSNARRGR